MGCRSKTLAHVYDVPSKDNGNKWPYPHCSYADTMKDHSPRSGCVAAAVAGVVFRLETFARKIETAHAQRSRRAKHSKRAETLSVTFWATAGKGCPLVHAKVE